MSARRVWIGAAALVLALSAIVWALTPGRDTFRRFDSTALGRAEARLWRDYYEHRALALAHGLVFAAHDDFGLSPWDSLRAGLEAANAARTFQASRSRAGAQAALPALTRHFAVLKRATHSTYDPAQEARLELEWWQVRRETDGYEPYVRQIAAATGYLYGVDPARLGRYAALRGQAMDLRDRRGAHITQTDWDRISALLVEAYGSLRGTLDAEAGANLAGREAAPLKTPAGRTSRRMEP
jgi:hypothetical protein